MSFPERPPQEDPPAWAMDAEAQLADYLLKERELFALAEEIEDGESGGWIDAHWVAARIRQIMRLPE